MKYDSIHPPNKFTMESRNNSTVRYFQTEIAEVNKKCSVELRNLIRRNLNESRAIKPSSDQDKLSLIKLFPKTRYALRKLTK